MTAGRRGPGSAAAMSGARLHDEHDDRRPADPGVEVDVPDVEVRTESPDEPDVDEAPEEQEDA